MTSARILLADEDVLFRSALAVVLADDGYAVVGQAGSAAEVRRLLPSGVDLVIASSTLPGGVAVSSSADLPSAVKLFVLSPVCEHAQLLAALEAGAQGYLGKDVRLDALRSALSAVLRGEAVVPRQMLGGLLHELVQQRRTPAPTGTRPLSRREQEVLELLAQGHSQEGIARALVISPQTARTHIQKVIGKLGAHSRVEAVAVAVKHGLVGVS